jgi:tetratricopeptide (TPR) repeat protein
MCSGTALLLGVAFLGCAGKPASRTVPKQAPAAAGSAQSAGNLPSEKACLKLAARIEETMNAGDASVFDGALDIDAVLDRALFGLEVSSELRAGLRSGMTSGSNLAQATCKAIAGGGSYKLLRVHDVAGERRALFRMISGSGFNYHDLSLAQGRDDATKVVDIYIFLAGEHFSAIVRRGALPALAEAKKSFLGKMLGSESDFMANLDDIQKMQALAAQGKHKEALAECLKLPASLQKDRNILVQRVTYAAKVGATAYNAAVADYRKWHPESPALQLMLLDYHFYRKEFDEALACIDGLDKTVGGDSYLDFMRANLHYSAGRTEEARATALKAVEREPTLIQPYWSLLTLSVEAKDFAETARLLTIVEEGFPVRFDALEEAEPYAEFVKSPEYEKWLAARAAREKEGGGDATPAPAGGATQE